MSIFGLGFGFSHNRIMAVGTDILGRAGGWGYRAEVAEGVPDSPEQAERTVRELRAAGRLTEAARLTEYLGPYGVAEDLTATASLGAAVLEAYGDQLATADPEAADAAYRRAAQDQRSFAGGATSGGEGMARMMEADRIDAKRRRP